MEASVPVPRLSLKEFKRIRLEAGASIIVAFTVNPEQLTLVDEDGNRCFEAGVFRFSVGGMIPGSSSPTTGCLTRTAVVTGEWP